MAKHNPPLWIALFGTKQKQHQSRAMHKRDYLQIIWEGIMRTISAFIGSAFDVKCLQNALTENNEPYPVNVDASL